LFTEISLGYNATERRTIADSEHALCCKSFTHIVPTATVWKNLHSSAVTNRSLNCTPNLVTIDWKCHFLT